MSLTLADMRIRLDAEPARQVRPALEVAMLGHAPGEADWRWLLDQPELVSQIELAGYYNELDLLRRLRDGEELSSEIPPDIDIDALTSLHRIPVPLASFSQFETLFPQAFTVGTHYRSQLAANVAWLPLAARDFFDRVRGNGPQRLWVIVVPESEQQEAFLPDPQTDWVNNILLSAFDRALGLPEVGLLALPDLERLQIPANLPDNPRLRLPNPPPAFLPCGNEYDDTHRERRNPPEVPRPVDPIDMMESLQRMAATLAKRRPDMYLLLGMPLDPEGDSETPRISPELLEHLADCVSERNCNELRRVQLTFPYLRSAQHSLQSACGVLAAEMAKRTRQGAWLSIAGRPLGNVARPYPPVHQNRASELRERHALGILVEERGQVKLDDERIASGVFGDAAEHARSGEIARFLGWLQRELRRLGEQLVFDVDPQDPRPRILLESFFGQLHARGALRGAMPRDAFSIRQSAPAESTLLFEIELAPAFPIDRIRLTITRDGPDNGWQVGGLSGGRA